MEQYAVAFKNELPQERVPLWRKLLEGKSPYFRIVVVMERDYDNNTAVIVGGLIFEYFDKVNCGLLSYPFNFSFSFSFSSFFFSSLIYIVQKLQYYEQFIVYCYCIDFQSQLDICA